MSTASTTTEIDPASRIFVSGDVVEPGLYRDMETGALVRLFETDELPDNRRIVRSMRLFRRVEPDKK